MALSAIAACVILGVGWTIEAIDNHLLVRLLICLYVLGYSISMGPILYDVINKDG
jgi:hypothetical protein